MNDFLNLPEERVDRTKSSVFLYYLARASSKLEHRDIAHKKVKLSINQLKQINDKRLSQHVEELEGHIAEALRSEKQIKAHQQGEEGVHIELTHKITKLEHKLGRYLDTQDERKKRVDELERKIKEKFETKRKTVVDSKKDIERLTKLYKEIKKDKKHSTSDLLRVANKIASLKDALKMVQ
ncbi:hypothetical protein J4219_02650 [Candidatus Woesearchaeota archaeon]|nr:hypothetical protein [Candidatus Woesearchaeota archaeon]